MDRIKLERRLDRLTKQRGKLNKKYEGNEANFTFHAGYDVGYLEGKISILDDMIRMLSEEATVLAGIKETGNIQTADEEDDGNDFFLESLTRRP